MIQRVQLSKVFWFGLISLIFVVLAVPDSAAQAAKTQPPAATAKVDINNATARQLEELPGVGKATASKIIAGRPYASVDDLAKAGVPKSTIAKLSPFVIVGPASTQTKPAAAAAPAEASSAASQGRTNPAVSNAPAPPAAGMVWVNLETKVYHKPGDRWYGKTKNGKYMTEADAIKAGYRPVKERQKK